MDYAFQDCEHLIKVEIPNSVTSIGQSAFYNCRNLKNFTIPNSVTTIGLSAFQSCRSLTSITIPNSVTYIGGYLFEGCSGLTSISIGSSITSGVDRSLFSEYSEYFHRSIIEVDNNNPVYDSRNNCNAIIKTSENKLLV
jgi:hypothetical protein